jgi:hypothetical protein
LIDVTEVCAASIIRANMEAVRTSETSVNFNVTTRRFIPEDTKLHTRCRENLKSRIINAYLFILLLQTEWIACSKPAQEIDVCVR